MVIPKIDVREATSLSDWLTKCSECRKVSTVTHILIAYLSQNKHLQVKGSYPSQPKAPQQTPWTTYKPWYHNTTAFTATTMEQLELDPEPAGGDSEGGTETEEVEATSELIQQFPEELVRLYFIITSITIFRSETCVKKMKDHTNNLHSRVNADKCNRHPGRAGDN